MLRKGDVFAGFQLRAHGFGREGSPGTVLHQRYRAILVIVSDQFMDEFPHIREHIRIVSGGGQNQLAIAEGIFHTFGHILTCQIGHHYLGAALLGQPVGEQLRRGFRVAVDGSVSDHDTFGFHAVGGPGLVQIYIISKIFFQDRSVQRADSLDVQSRGLL